MKSKQNKHKAVLFQTHHSQNVEREKKENLESNTGKQFITYKGTPVRLIVDFYQKYWRTEGNRATHSKC